MNLGAMGSVMAVLKQGTVRATINPVPGSWAGMLPQPFPTKTQLIVEPNCEGLVVCLTEI